MTRLTLGDIQSRAHHVHVTAEHISQGVQTDAQQCAVAVALEGAFADTEVEVIAVNHVHITVGQGLARWHADTPEGACAFIIAYDDASWPHGLNLLKEEAEAGRLQWDLDWHEGNPPMPAENAELAQ